MQLTWTDGWNEHDEGMREWSADSVRGEKFWRVDMLLPDYENGKPVNCDSVAYTLLSEDQFYQGQIFNSLEEAQEYCQLEENDYASLPEYRR